LYDFSNVTARKALSEFKDRRLATFSNELRISRAQATWYEPVYKCKKERTVMKIKSAEFEANTGADSRQMILDIVDQSTDIYGIIDGWVTAGKGHIGLSAALDDDMTLLPATTALYFDSLDRTELGTIFLSHEELAHSCPDAKDLESFLIRSSGKWKSVELDSEKFDHWATEIGLTDSFALMSRIGPRSSISHLAVTFGLSPRGIIEISPPDASLAEDEDYGPDLAEEGIAIGEYLRIQACFSHSRTCRENATRTILDTIYCRGSE
jgi:hypothetical protein